MRLSHHSERVETNIMSQRHQLIYIRNHARFELTSPHTDTDIIKKAVYHWIDAGLPCIYTRQQHKLPSSVNLGLTLLIDNHRYRAGLLIDQSVIERETRLPRLNECMELFPGLQSVSDLDSTHVYGSFLFQYLSKNALFPISSFVNKHSDLDILLDYKKASLHALAHNIKLLADATQRTIDGEVRFHGVGDISITELINMSTDKLLVKTPTNTILMRRKELYEYYPSLLD